MADNDEQEYQAAFREASGDTSAAPITDAAPIDEAEQAAENEQDQGAETPPADPETNPTDMWANAPDDLKAAYQAAIQERDRLEHQRRSDEGRVSRYQRERDAVVQRLAPLVTASKQEDPSAYIKSEDWRKAKEEYGSDLGPLFRAFEAMTEQNSALQQHVGLIAEDRADQYFQQVEAKVTERAPDWPSLMSDPAFPAWAQTQPRYVQEVLSRNMERFVDPDEVTMVFEQFRASRQQNEPTAPAPQPQKDPKRAVQLDGSRSARTQQPTVMGEVDKSYEGYFHEAAALADKQLAPARR